MVRGVPVVDGWSERKGPGGTAGARAGRVLIGLFSRRVSYLLTGKKESIRKHARNASILTRTGIKLKQNGVKIRVGAGPETAVEMALKILCCKASLGAAGAAVDRGGDIAKDAMSSLPRRRQSRLAGQERACYSIIEDQASRIFFTFRSTVRSVTSR